jgi:hypothetical protein
VVVAAQRSQIGGDGSAAVLVGHGVVLVAVAGSVSAADPHTGAIPDLDVAA